MTSPGGTTIRGIQVQFPKGHNLILSSIDKFFSLQVLERSGFRGAVMDAVQASAERAAELGRKDTSK